MPLPRWLARFNRRVTNVLGRRVTMDGHSHTIIGVLPEGFRYAGRNDDIYEPVTVRTGRGRGSRVRKRVR